jgi:uncharacterized membrane protein
VAQAHGRRLAGWPGAPRANERLMGLALIIIGCYLCLVAVVLAFAKAASTADDQMDRATEIEREARAAGAITECCGRP